MKQQDDYSRVVVFSRVVRPHFAYGILCNVVTCSLEGCVVLYHWSYFLHDLLRQRFKTLR
jgi:hypothetical protein